MPAIAAWKLKKKHGHDVVTDSAPRCTSTIRYEGQCATGVAHEQDTYDWTSYANGEHANKTHVL